MSAATIALKLRRIRLTRSVPALYALADKFERQFADDEATPRLLGVIATMAFAMNDMMGETKAGCSSRFATPLFRPLASLGTYCDLVLMAHNRRSREKALIPRPAITGSAGTPKAKTLAIRLADIAEPDPVGFANRFAVRKFSDSWEFSFFERRGEVVVPVTRIVVPPDSLLNFLQQGTLEYLKEVGSSSSSGVEQSFVETEAPDWRSAPSPLANVIYVARSGMSAGISFYYLTPFSHSANMRTGQKLKIVPVALVQCPTRLTLQFVEVIRDALPEFRVAAGHDPEEPTK
jgi:hypothetical protein